MFLFVISIIIGLMIINFIEHKRFEKDKQKWCNSLTENLEKSNNKKILDDIFKYSKDDKNYNKFLKSCKKLEEV